MNTLARSLAYVSAVLLLTLGACSGIKDGPKEANAAKSKMDSIEAEKGGIEEIEQLERARQDAFVRGDISAIERETAEDYTTVNSSGRMSNKPQMMKSLREGRNKVLSVTLDEMKARVYGNTAVLTGLYGDSSLTAGVRKENRARFIRIYVKDNGRWQAVAYQQTAAADK